jgi:DNA polymerase I-like protein with 3'-5' exonuclease and polymerase domains
MQVTPTKSQVLLFLGTLEDVEYMPKLRPLVNNARVFTVTTPVNTLTEVILYCKKRGITGVFSTNTNILQKLLALKGNDKKSPSLADYQGSYFQHQGIEFVFISPLKQLVTVSYGSFIARRFISKLSNPSVWKKVPAFNFELLTPANEAEIFQRYQEAIFISVDIETLREDLKIRCIGYTAIFLDKQTGVFSTHSCVLPISDMYAVSIMRKFNWELKPPKGLQNGKYDLSYLSRYNAVLYNYLWDTANMFHSWYSELPKDLAFLGAFFVREAMYWKDLADTSDTYEYYRYNALDTWTTALVIIAWICEAPEWAKRNYQQSFPLVFPCHLSEMTGIKRDMVALEKANIEITTEIENDNISLSKMLGTYPVIFNVNSNPQNIRLRTVLGCKDLSSSDEKNLKKIALRHPLNSRIVGKILDLRGNRKLASTYLPIATSAHLIPTMKTKDVVTGKELNGRILYSLNPHGTDTGRLASKEHHFWCGLQIQNIPASGPVKSTLIADDGFRIAEADLKQAETRDTAYISGDPNLIAAVCSPRDFHSINASAFFGVAYEDIYDDSKGKTLNKPLRDLSKRTNHGANYLMGWSVLIDTMGEDKVWEAKRLLKLPKHFGLRETAEYLLATFHKTYPTLSSDYYPAVVAEVVTTSMLVSHTNIQTPEVYGIEPIWPANWELAPMEGWTRFCFGDPSKNKLDKNAYVAHVSQSLNAQVLNKAYLRVFYEIAINPKYAPYFKLCAQIHDSILFQFKEGHEYLCKMVEKLMEVPVIIKSYDGVVRKFAVPADVKAGKDGMGALRWSETE